MVDYSYCSKRRSMKLHVGYMGSPPILTKYSNPFTSLPLTCSHLEKLDGSICLQFSIGKQSFLETRATK